ncbi:glycoside hydrolase [Lipomyces oligophaga]|uniref:glycoside hydrolase n=1 Tax=Lipomyces oligophaga TaxID=45792 RepID=UPI0034CECF31
MIRKYIIFLVAALLQLSSVYSWSDYDEENEYDLYSQDDENTGLLLAEQTRASNASLLWGPYRPNLYFGLRPRGIPESILTGLMWYNLDSYRGFSAARHSCEQSDKIDGYGWQKYDPRLGGRQVIHDTENKVDLTVEFAKDGRNWGARIHGNTRETGTKTAMVFYFGLDGIGISDLSNKFNKQGYAQTVSFAGNAVGIGNFKLDVTRGPSELNKVLPNVHAIGSVSPLSNTHVLNLMADYGSVWKAKDYYTNLLREHFQTTQMQYGRENMPPPEHLYLLEDVPKEGNLHFIQRNFQGDFEFDILFTADQSSPMTSAKLTTLLEQFDADFDERYYSVFPHSESFIDPKFEAFGKAMVSNLLGGIGYFQGKWLMDVSDSAYDDEEEEMFWEFKGAPEIYELGPSELFSAVPSRPFFPRGFSWDEGFHLLLIMRWDPDLSLEILKSWFKTIDREGWIPREQILGDEARSKVPPEFQTQSPMHANPPTLVLAVGALLDRIEEYSYEDPKRPRMPVANDEDQVLLAESLEEDVRIAYLHTPALARAALRKMYPAIKLHYNWYRRTQAADLRTWHNGEEARPPSWTEAFRWRGRTPNHCLASGLDDYPRAKIPHPAEVHVDLMAWMAAMSKTMERLARFVEAPEADIERYEKVYLGVVENLEELHWSENDGLYCDLGWDPEQDSRVKVCHEGYVTLLPFVLGLVPANKIRRVLDGIEDEERLWSEHGIRSLSKADAVFGKDENYWRGSVWVNMNYLVLRSLQAYAGSDSEVDEAAKARIKIIYRQLRRNLVQNIARQWQETGFAFEQYEEGSGKGKGVKHFTGWTALATEIMCMPDEL